jgi:hypothetical protein
LYKKYYNHIEFLNIYIREAHPIDGWWMGRRLTRGLVKLYSNRVSMDYYDPKTIEERRAVAGDCQEALRFGVRTYVDNMDDMVNKAYAAWPTRQYLVGLDGKVVYAGKMGPRSLKPKELEVAIEEYLREIS